MVSRRVICAFASSPLAAAESHLVIGLVDGLGLTHPGQSKEILTQVVSDALQMELDVGHVNANDIVCARDYSGACPDGWSDAGDGQQCLSSAQYTGPCPTQTTFGMTPAQKGARAAECGTAFPCSGACPRDYAAPCPQGWSTKDASCVAPSEYEGPCVEKKDFSTFSAAEKASWALACSVVWPCRVARSSEQQAPCQDLRSSDACPADWLASQGYCHAPASYSGPCPLTVRAAAYSVDQKDAFSKACQVSWC